MLDAQGVVTRCIVIVKQPQIILPQVLSFLTHTDQSICCKISLKTCLTDCLALCQELSVDNVPHIEEGN